MRRHLVACAAALLAAPALWQLGLLLYTMASRLTYPYDLEWMEGGMLNHALRLSEGHSIYAPPSVDFIPYLYTPLYPALLALLGRLFGLGYLLGRSVSVLAILGLIALTAVALVRGRTPRALAWLGAATAVGFFAATYPWVEGWYDLVRGDMLFLVLGTGGLFALRIWARRPRLVAVAAAIIALSFFAKQTGVLFVAAGGGALLVLNWRALPIYVAVAGALGGGGSWLLNRLTDGWYWIYVFDVHQQHDTNGDRFYRSFVLIFSHFPALTALVALGLGAVAVTRIRTGRLPNGAADFLFWSYLFLCGTVIGALGWATQWAHWNAYVPAMTFGGIAAGAALVPLFDALPRWASWPIVVTPALQLALARWSPAPFIPSAADRAAGDALIARVAAIPGEVFIPSHPWYAHLAAKPTFTHRMGILDVTYDGGPGKKPLPPKARQVEGLSEALQRGRFAAVILDDKGQLWEFPGLTEGYRPEATIAPTPRVVTGAQTVPRTLWLPFAEPPPPAGTRVRFDFEGRTWEGWQVTGDAWGPGPARGVPGKQIFGTRGHAFASANSRGDAGTGTLLSPPFTLEGTALTVRVAGGSGAGERIELRDAASGAVLRTANGPKSMTMNLVRWNTTDLIGRTVRFAAVDEETGTWGVLWVDDVREEGLPQ